MPARLTILFLLAPITGCASVGVHVANPASTGTLGRAHAVYLDRIESSMAHTMSVPPQTMRDTATLVRLDGQSVCFDIVTRLDQAAGTDRATPYVTLDPAVLHLEYDGGSLDTPTIEARALTRVPITGQMDQIYTEEGDPTQTWHEQVIAVNMEVVSGGGVACFAHRGAIAARNHHLRLSYPELNFRVKFDFQLDATTPPSAWPSGPIVAAGYERLAQ